MASKQALTRLRKELKAIGQDPPPHIHVSCDESNILAWSYLLEGPPDTPYYGGWYWGRLKFPRDYPFSPPSILMVTPNGRFQTNMRLCLSMSDYHPESWQPAWSLATVLKGLLSFMCEESPTAGAVDPPPSNEERQRLAQCSLEWNKAHGDFLKAFPEVESIVAEVEAQRAAPRPPPQDQVEGEEEVQNFAAGDAVRIQGLKAKPEYNGRLGKIGTETVGEGRLPVEMDGEILALRPANLLLLRGGV